MGRALKPQAGKRLSKRTLFLINFVLFLIPMTYYGYQPFLRYCASALMVNDAPKKSDAIVILAGGEPGRAWEAADLYNGKLAPYVVVTKDLPTFDEEQLRKYGIELVDGRGNYIRVLRGLGVPEEKIVTVKTPVEDTFSEITAVRELCKERGWKSLVIVTSNYHTRRARLTARYILGSGIDVSVVASSHGGLNRASWWKNNADARTFLIEFQKLVAYTLYIWPRMIWTSQNDTNQSSILSASLNSSSMLFS